MLKPLGSALYISTTVGLDIHLFNQYDIDHVNCGILILYTQHGAVKERSFTWIDPYMYVEGAVWDAGS